MLSTLVVHCPFPCAVTSLPVKYFVNMLDVNCYVCLSPMPYTIRIHHRCFEFCLVIPMLYLCLVCLFDVFHMFITHSIHLANILFLTCLHSPCNVPVFFFACDICLSVPCSTYTELKYTIPTRTTYMHIRCLSVTHHVPCNLLLCGHCCYVIQMASWDKCFATPFM